MFAMQSTYDRLRAEHRRTLNELAETRGKFTTLIVEWNELVRRVNKENYFTGKRSNQFSPDDLDRILILCHPDKHGGKQIATEITQKILEIRAR